MAKICLLFFLMVFTTATLLSAAPLFSWTGDEQTLAANATFQNGATTTLDGKYGKAFSFDGTNDYINVPHQTSLNVGSAFSISLWVKGDLSQYSSDKHFTIVDKSHRSTESSPYWSGWTIQGRIDSNPGKVGFALGNGSTFYGVGSQSSILDGQWHHLAGTFDGTYLKFYVDGILQGTAAFSGSVANNTGALNIGRWAYGGTRYFHGLVDEVGYYNYSLNAAEIGGMVPEPGSILLLGFSLIVLLSKKSF